MECSLIVISVNIFQFLNRNYILFFFICCLFYPNMLYFICFTNIN
mgnify:CR=1 FL=1